MKKQWVIFDVIVILLILTAGVWLGVNIESSRIQKQQQYSDSIQTTIAVVNQDMGDFNNGEKENYSSSIINKLGEDYVLVSAQEAQTGYDNGIYGTIITFPSNLSTNIISINEKKPEKVNLSYLINSNLPESKYIESYKKVIDLQYEVNQMISYMYVYSIYNEVHSAQNQVNSIFQNDQDDMSAMEEVKLYNFTEYLELGDIPKPPLDLQRIDFDSFVEEVKGNADSISNEYLDSYAKAKEDYEVFGDNLVDLGQTIKQESSVWEDEMKQWETDITAYDNLVITYGNDLDNWKNSAIQWNDDNKDWYDDLVSYKETADNLKDGIDKFKSDSSDFTQIANNWNNTATTWSNNILQSQVNREQVVVNSLQQYNENYDKLNNYSQALQDWEDELKLYVDDLPAGDPPELVLPDGFEMPDDLNEIDPWENEIFEECPTIDDADIQAFNGTINEPPEFSGAINIPEIPEPPEKIDLTIPEQSQPLVNAINEIVLNTHNYNPENYLTYEVRSSINKYVNDYSEHLFEVKNALNDNLAGNIDVLEEAYKEYNDYVFNLKNQAIECNDLEQENLQNGLNIFYNAKTETSNENKELLGFFSKMMPNSKIDSMLNKNVVEFTVAPISFVDTNVRDKQLKVSFTKEKVLNILKTILMCLFLLICIILLWILLSYLFKKKKEDEEILIN